MDGPDCFGWVFLGYRISKTEVTNAQYTEFLNAVAAISDPTALYNTNMASSPSPNFGGITRTCTGTCSYAVIPGRGERPVNWVSFYDALRFANWLHNNQPTGAQGPGTTEGGAYTLLGGTPTPSNGLTVTRNTLPGLPGALFPTATFFLPSEDEWYRAAYFDPYTSSYQAYPTIGVPTVCHWFISFNYDYANCDFQVGDLYDVGTYYLSRSWTWTYDQGGNVSEWNEAIIGGASRGQRGGGLESPRPPS